jgi:hypothetical protein
VDLTRKKAHLTRKKAHLTRKKAHLTRKKTGFKALMGKALKPVLARAIKKY